MGKTAPRRAAVPIRSVSAGSCDPCSLAQTAYVHIKRMILSGTLKDGEKIPEEGIALILDMSRTPIREAIRRLGQYGLIEIKPRSYARVAGVTSREAEQIALIRNELERLAAKSLVRKATEKDVAALGRIAERMVSKYLAGNPAEAFELDTAFHLEMVRRSDNGVIYDVLERLDAKNQLIRVRNIAKLPENVIEEHFREHLTLVDLLAIRDEKRFLATLKSNILPRK